MRPLVRRAIAAVGLAAFLMGPGAAQTVESRGDAPGVLKSEITGTLFDKFLKFHTYEVVVGSKDGPEVHRGGFVHGPGHHVAAIASFLLDEQGRPHPVFKSGDTRLARAERGEPYVATGGIAGRLDKAGVGSGKIALGELAEEVGGSVAEATFRSLGDDLVPTMPNESTEADLYSMAVVVLDGSPYGDGGQMEVPDLIGPVFYTAREAIEAMDRGEIADSGRARTMFARAFDVMGFLPELNVYAQDHPRLKERFDTLGLGETFDVRARAEGSRIVDPPLRNVNEYSQINAVVCRSRAVVALDSDQRMVDAQTSHAIEVNGLSTPLRERFANQYMQTDYDRVKLAVVAWDSHRGPLVEFTWQVRPALAFAPGSPRVVRQDVTDLKCPRDGDLMERLSSEFSGPITILGPKTGASSGQSDLYYHFAFCRATDEVGENFLELSEAIRHCRQGQGDAQTEALLLRLADHFHWIPTLNMSVSQARQLL